MDNGLMTFKEIGEKMGLTENHVHYIYRQAMKKLQKLFSENPQLSAELKLHLNPLKEIGIRSATSFGQSQRKVLGLIPNYLLEE